MTARVPNIVPAVAAHFSAEELREAQMWLEQRAEEFPCAESGDTVFPDALQQKLARELEQASDKTLLEVEMHGLSPEIISRLVARRVRIPHDLRAKPTVRLRTPETDRALAKARSTPPTDAELRVRQLEAGLIALLDLIPYGQRTLELIRITDMAKEGMSQRQIAEALNMDRGKVRRRLELILKASEITSLSGVKEMDELATLKPISVENVNSVGSVAYATKQPNGDRPSVYL